MANINIGIETPDDFDGVVKVGQYPKKHFMGANYGRFYLDGFLDLASDKQLNLTDVRVLLGLLGYLDFENLINVTQSQLEKDIKVNQGNIAKSIKKLIDKGYLIVMEQKGRQNIYYLNPNFGVKTRGSNKRLLERAWEENQTDSVYE